MKTIKITETQAKMLEKMNSKKVMKITKEQYDKLISLETTNLNTEDINKSFISNMPDNTQKMEHSRNVGSVTKFKNISELDDLWGNFISELYSISESTDKKYNKLIQLMEVAGFIKDGKIKKSVFKGDKKLTTDIITSGLHIMEETNNPYRAIEHIESSVDLSKDMDSDTLFKTFVEDWLSNNEHVAVQNSYDKGDYKTAWFYTRQIGSNPKTTKITDETTSMGGGVYSGPSGAPIGKYGDTITKSNVPTMIDDIVDETTSTVTAGNYAYATPGFASSKFFGNENKEGKARVNKGITHKKTTIPGGSFVEFDSCTKLNNNKEAQKGGCSVGAVDNVVKLKKN
jgi:hypothetical protein